jgi:hypothetical protein
MKQKQSQRGRSLAIEQARRERVDDVRAGKWLAKHFSKTNPKPKPKELPLERWQKRLQAQKVEWRATARPLLKGVK